MLLFERTVNLSQIVYLSLVFGADVRLYLYLSCNQGCRQRLLAAGFCTARAQRAASIKGRTRGVVFAALLKAPGCSFLGTVEASGCRKPSHLQ